jgi:glycosyltransferase involved in cell wall biosynthesis
MKKVLLSAYACQPNAGSEEGNGWFFAKLLALEGIEVHCITQQKFKVDIDAVVSQGGFSNTTFHYVDTPGWLNKAYRYLIGMYSHYIYWQWEAAKRALELDRQYNFDLVHHITYSSVQLGSFMYRVKKPFIFGPVGGGQEAPAVMKRYFGKYWIRERLRSWTSTALRYVNPGYYNTLKKADLVIVSNKDTYKLVRRVRPEKPIHRMQDAAIGQNFFPKQEVERVPGKTLKLLWVGRLLPRKALELTIETLAKVNPAIPLKLTIVGGHGQMAELVPGYIEKYGVADRIDWVGHVTYDQVTQFYRESDVFFFTSLRDSGPMQTMEAMAYSLPVVTLALHGQDEQVNEEIGIKATITTPDDVVAQLASAVEWMYEHPEERLQMGRVAYAYANSQVWEKRIKTYVNEIYPTLLPGKPEKPIIA